MGSCSDVSEQYELRCFSEKYLFRRFLCPNCDKESPHGFVWSVVLTSTSHFKCYCYSIPINLNQLHKSVYCAIFGHLKKCFLRHNNETI